MSRKQCKHRIAVIIETNVPIDREDAMYYMNHMMQLAMDNMPIDEFVSEPKPKTYVEIEDVTVE